MKKKKALLYNLVVRGHRLSFHSVHWFQETENCECIIIRLTPDSFWILHNKGKWFTCKTKHFEDSLEFSYMKMQFVTPSFRFKTPKFWLDFGILRPSWFWQAFLMRPSISCMRRFKNWVTCTCRFNRQRPLFRIQKQIYCNISSIFYFMYDDFADRQNLVWKLP